MKKLLLLFAMVTTMFAASARENYSYDVNTLPPAAQTMLRNNFKAKVNHIKIDKNLGHVSEYDVVLNDGSEITFDSDGNWKEIEVSRSSAVPKKLVPSSISKYVKHNVGKTAIVGIEKERRGYSVELSNSVEMKFDAKGKFLRYDD